MVIALASHQRGPGSGHEWIKLVVSSLLCSERFFSGFSGFLLSSIINISKFQFDRMQDPFSSPEPRILWLRMTRLFSPSVMREREELWGRDRCRTSLEPLSGGWSFLGKYYTLNVWSRGEQLVLFSRES